MSTAIPSIHNLLIIYIRYFCLLESVMTDGDDTYPAEEAGKLCEAVLERNADMVVGDRLSSSYFEENKCTIIHPFYKVFFFASFSALLRMRSSLKKFLSIWEHSSSMTPLTTST